MEDRFPPNRAAAKGTKYEQLYDTPAHWPEDVHYLTNDNMEMMGRRESTNELLWDGSPLVTERRLANVERFLIAAGVLAGFIAAGAAVVQAWAAVASIPPHP